MPNPNQNYREAYEAWVKSLSTEERSKLKTLKLDKPMLDDHTTFAPDYDKAFEQMSAGAGGGQPYTPPPTTEAIDDAKVKAYGSLLLCWVFQRLQGLRSQRQSAFESDALLFALGLDNLLTEKTQTALAKRYGVSRAAVSMRVKAWQKLLGLKPSALMKTETACRHYRRTRLRNLTRG